MDFFSVTPFDFLESSSSTDDVSDYCNNIINTSSSQSDEDVLLASKTPKRKAGRIKFRETRHPVYRGIRKRNGGKWVCEVREPKKKSRIWLGTFPTAVMAARAHDVAAIALRGKSACLNFADSAWRLPVPVTANVKDIQRAAAEAAEAFRPTSSQESTEEEEEEGEGSEQSSLPPDEGGATLMLPEEHNMLFIDEEALFNMPTLMSYMAEALMFPLPPPSPGHCQYHQDVDVTDSLWSYPDYIVD